MSAPERVSIGLGASDFATRRARLRKNLVDAHLDALLVTDPANVRYLCGLPPARSALLLSAAGDDTSRLMVHPSSHQLALGLVPDLQVLAVERGDIAAVQVAGPSRMGIEARHLTVARYQQLSEEMLRPGVLMATSAMVESLRQIKDEQEISLLRQAAHIADTALAALVEDDGIGIGHTEYDVARDLEAAILDHGAESVAFPVIVASGENTADPHHRPSNRLMRRGDLVKVDFGAVVQGYRSDMTRVFVLGAPSPWQQELHALVTAAAKAGRDALRPGVAAADADNAARQVIAAAGHGERFTHGLGHGVGLDVREAPWLAPSSPGTIAMNMTVTVEPGIYLPGYGGVRIEDSGVVGPDRYRPFTLSRRDLVQL